MQTTADANGRYELLRLPPGAYRVECKRNTNLPVRRPQAGEVTELYAASAVEVDSGHATNLDISFSSPEEWIYSCSCSMDDDDLEKLLRATSPRDPETALHISVDNRAVAPESEVWMTVVLTNTADHPVSIAAERNSNHAFAYNIGMWDPCNCPIGGARVGESKTAGEGTKNSDVAQEHNTSVLVVPLAPGASLTDRVELGKLLNLAESRTYRIRVSRPYNSAGKAVDPGVNPAQAQLSIKSNRVSVMVMRPERASESRQMQDDPTPLPKECANADLKKLGQPVMVDECGGSKILWGFSVGTGRATYGKQVPIYFWLVNQSDQPQTTDSCQIDWWVQEGLEVFDATGNRLLTGYEQKNPQYPKSLVADALPIMCIRTEPYRLAAHSCIKPELPFNLAESYVLTEGEYAISPRKTTDECTYPLRKDALPRVHPGRLTISIEPSADRP